MLMAALNTQICTSHVLTGIEAISAPNGGSVSVLADRPCHPQWLLARCVARPLICDWASASTSAGPPVSRRWAGLCQNPIWVRPAAIAQHHAYVRALFQPLSHGVSAASLNGWAPVSVAWPADAVRHESVLSARAIATMMCASRLEERP